MKKILIYFLLIAFGSVMTFSLVHAIAPNSRLNKNSQKDVISARPVVFTMDEQGKAVPLDFTGTAKKVMDAVVNIQSTHIIKNTGGDNQMPEQFRQFFDDHDFFRYFFGPDQRPEMPKGNGKPDEVMGIGSGVIISQDGYILTNNHVVNGSDELDVTLHDNRTYKAKVIGTDPSTDLAVIQIPEKNLPTIPFANSDDAQVGEWVLAVGNPYGLTSTVTAGIISAKSRSLGINSAPNAVESFIQTDAAINPGNSGGALVDLEGRLVGINTAIASPTGSYSGYGFAISSDMVQKVSNDIIKYGSVKRGYLGIMMRSITGKFANDHKLKANQGAYVDSVMNNSAAAEAGIHKGDIVTSVDGNAIRESAELQEYVARHSPGDKIAITVNRNGDTKTLNAVLKEITKTEMASAANSSLQTSLGADFKAIDKNLASKLSIDGGVQITKLYPGKLTNNTDIKEGFIITSVNDQPVKTVDDLMKALDKRQGSGVMLEGVYENVPGKYYYAFGM